MEIVEKITHLVEGVEGGNLNALKVYVELKKVEDVLTASLKQLKDTALDEAQKYGAKQFEEYGCVIQVKNAAGKWDFSKVTTWNNLKNDIKRVEDMAKQAYKNNAPLINGDTGEYVEIPTYTEGGTTLAITIKQ